MITKKNLKQTKTPRPQSSPGGRVVNVHFLSESLRPMQVDVSWGIVENEHGGKPINRQWV